MNFASDNTAPAHPRVMEAVMRANEGYAAPYGAEPRMAELTARLREIFEAPDAEVFLVATGTTANSLALATLVQPWQAIYCSRVAHIHTDECGAPEFYTNGAKLVLVDEDHGLIKPDALEQTVQEGLGRAIHYVQPGAVALTQVTERGTVYPVQHLGALGNVARAYGLPVHLDGARFANAMVSLGCTPAEMTWKAGVDAVSFGATKNGCLDVEAVIFFEPGRAMEFEHRRKRAGHLFSKHRYFSAQMAAYLEEDLWLEMARSANAAGSRLEDGLNALPHAELHHPVDANMLFVSLPRAAHRRAVEAGAFYYLSLSDLDGGSDDDPISVRLVTNWSTTEDEVDQFLSLVA